jgi:NodT family efflux transporter outer membrane factor (OMF) lipoprotein
MHRLAVLLGQQPGALIAELSPESPIPGTPPEVPVGLPSELLRRRPDIRAAERDVAAANARIGQATAELYPRFFITGNIGLSSTKFSNFFDSSSVFWGVGPSFTWSLFQGGRIRANIAVQDSRTKQALAGYQQTILLALEETENAMVRYAREQTRMLSLAEAVDANLRAVDLSNQLYTRGLTAFLNVIEAQRALYLTQDELVQSEAAVTTNLIALYKSLGGGWDYGSNSAATQTALALQSAR